jgi:uncharacterized protein (TIGR03437 family)
VNALSVDDIVPQGHGNNYFAGGKAATNSSLTQSISLSSGASTIDAGSVVFALSGYVGAYGSHRDYPIVQVAFQDAGGNSLTIASQNVSGTTSKLAQLPQTSPNDRANQDNGLMFRRVIGLVPANARTAVVTVTFTHIDGSYNEAYADNLSLILNAPATAASLMNANLMVNPNADAAPGYTNTTVADTSPDLPGWVRTAWFAADAYTDPNGDLDTHAPGPSDRGANYFWGGGGVISASSPSQNAYQDIDVSSAASLIDGGKVTYSLSGWIGGYSDQGDNCTVTAQFFNWGAVQLGSATIGPVTANDRQQISELLQRSTNGTIPSGTRYIRILIVMTRTDGSDDDGVADSLSFTLASPSAGNVPAISGIVNAGSYGAFQQIAVGSWIEIYGTNLAGNTRSWTGSDFNGTNAPTAMDGVKVTVAGLAAFPDYISPSQINVQVPYNVPVGQVQVVVTNPNGTSSPYAVNNAAYAAGLLAPSSFNVGGKQYVAAQLPDGTWVLPPGAVSGLTTRQAKPGETITIYGVGFGTASNSSNQQVMPGTIAPGSSQLASTFQMLFDGTMAQLGYSGLAPQLVGLYQFNVVVPSIANNDTAALTFKLAGNSGTQTLYTAVHQ